MNQIQDQEEKKFLKSWLHVREILSVEGCSYGTGCVYDYMLARFMWHQKYGREFFEGQELIAATTLVSLRTVKDAIKFLKDNKLLFIEKIKTAKFSRNRYVVVDRFGAYSHLEEEIKPKPKSKKPPSKTQDEEDLEANCPF